MNKNIFLTGALAITFFLYAIPPSHAYESSQKKHLEDYYSLFTGKINENNRTVKNNSGFSNFMTEYDYTSQPIGFTQFCNDNPNTCNSGNKEHEVPSGYRRQLSYNADLHQKISLLNNKINRLIKPVSDQDNYNIPEYWSFPKQSTGDCEDYVLLKKYHLMNLGIPEQVLLITVVRDEIQDGHAVLTIVTDVGDLILDNKVDKIVFWHNTPYDYIKRQSQQSPLLWKLLKKSS